jgi:hypothetical protein
MKLISCNKETLMLKRKSLVPAVAAALIAAAPVCFAQTAAPSGTLGTFGANPGVGPAPITGAPITGGFNPAPGSVSGSSSIGGSTSPETPSGTLGTFGANPGVGPAPIVGSTPSITSPTISSSPSVTAPGVLGPAPTSPGVIGGPMGPCVPGSVANPC